MATRPGFAAWGGRRRSNQRDFGVHICPKVRGIGILITEKKSNGLTQMVNPFGLIQDLDVAPFTEASATRSDSVDDQ